MVPFYLMTGQYFAIHYIPAAVVKRILGGHDIISQVRSLRPSGSDDCETKTSTCASHGSKFVAGTSVLLINSTSQSATERFLGLAELAMIRDPQPEICNLIGTNRLGKHRKVFHKNDRFFFTSVARELSPITKVSNYEIWMRGLGNSRGYANNMCLDIIETNLCLDQYTCALYRFIWLRNSNARCEDLTRMRQRESKRRNLSGIKLR